MLETFQRWWGERPGEPRVRIQEVPRFVIATRPAQQYCFPVMTRKEFTKKSEALKRIGAWCVAGLVTSVFGLLAGDSFLSSYIQQHYLTDRWNTSAGILELVWMFGCLIGLSYLEWNLAKKWGLACPGCGKRFIDKMRRLVLLTGKCPKCKTEVFEDKAINAPLCSQPLNREDFKMKFENFTRRLNHKLIRLMIIAMAAMFGSVPLSKYIQHLVENGDLDSITLTQWRWFAVVMLASVFLAFSSIFISAALGKFKLRDLPCPDCGSPLVGGAGRLAVETGMCVYCGCRLFEVPSSEKSEEFHCE